jgi:hypothetical protein
VTGVQTCALPISPFYTRLSQYLTNSPRFSEFLISLTETRDVISLLLTFNVVCFLSLASIVLR